MPANDNLYDQLLARGFSKREIDQQLHHVVMWYIREGKKEELLAGAAEESTVHRPQSTEKEQRATNNKKPASGNLQHETSNLQQNISYSLTAIFNRIRHALHLIQTQFAKKPKNPV